MRFGAGLQDLGQQKTPTPTATDVLATTTDNTPTRRSIVRIRRHVVHAATTRR